MATCWVIVEAPTGRRSAMSRCEVGDRGAHDAQRVDARMRVEVLVLGREERLDHALRNRLDRHEHPLLVGELGQQSAVAGVHDGSRSAAGSRRAADSPAGPCRSDASGTAHQRRRPGRDERPGAPAPRTASAVCATGSLYASRSVSPPGLHGARPALVRRILLRNKDRSRAPPRRPALAIWASLAKRLLVGRSSTGSRARPAPRACRAT